MTDKSRLGKLERELPMLEAEFREMLIAALHRCANGRWGLLGRNARPHLSEATRRYSRSSDAEALLALGERIAESRRKLGSAEPFDLYDRLLQLRGLSDPNALGEPKLARQWLDELERTDGRHQPPMPRPKT